jgi:hypothetical protein
MGFRGGSHVEWRGKTMAEAPGWRPDPERADQERYWSGSAWTDRVRPAGKAGSLHVPEHVPQLHRALSAATADIDAVEDRLSVLFERTDGLGDSDPRLTAATPSSALQKTSLPDVDPPDEEDDEILDLYSDEDAAGDGTVESVAGEAPARADDDDPKDAAFAELDVALAAEESDDPEVPHASKRRWFRRS